jgi:dihydropteroate synthase
MAPRERFTWKLRTRTLPLGDRTRIMGILNVTPDSFSDGGKFLAVDNALAQALRLLDEGADIIDIGGESTRPGAGAGTSAAISEKEEQSRILPLIEALLHARSDVIISVDTYRSSTAREALRLGAEIVNDVSGMQWDTSMANVCASTGCGTIAMHTRGLPSEWATQPRLQPNEILPLILHGLRTTAAQLIYVGCDRQAILLDPGFGFGKRGDENWVILREFDRLNELGFPLLAGLSRKGFLRSTLSAAASRENLDHATAAANAIAALAGAHLIRVHDVAQTARALAVADTMRNDVATAD